MSNCVLKIEQLLNDFSGQEQSIARYILKNSTKVSNMTIKELAVASKSSPATIVRFCNTLGFKGYREFVKELYVEVSNGSNSQEYIYDVNNPYKGSLSTSQIIDLVTKVNVDSLIDTKKILNEEAFAKSIEVLHKARRVVILAVSGSEAVAKDAEFKFNRLGIDATAYSYPHDQYLACSRLQKDEAVLAISYSGETKSIIQALTLAKETNAKIVGITKYGENSISKLCDLNIHHSNVGKGTTTYSTRSRLVQLNVIDMLFIGLRQKRGKELNKYYNMFVENSK